MKNLKFHFHKCQEKHPSASSYLNFARAVKGRRFSKDAISRWFTKLVEKDDYDKRDRKQLIAHLAKLSNPLEDNGKQG